MRKWTPALLALVLIVSLGQAALAETVQVLLLGTDDLGQSVTGNEEQSRADAIFLLSLDTEGGAIKVLSVERDYLVTLPDDLGPNKLGTSTFFGGPRMCMDAVNELFGLKVDRYAQISLKNLVSIVDLIGGIEVDIHEDEVEPTNWFIKNIPPFDLPLVKSGINLLDGNQTWAFMGNRDVEQPSVQSNQGRNSRQMRAIAAGLDKLQYLGVDSALNLSKQVAPLIDTNLSMFDLLSLFIAAMRSDRTGFDYLYSPAGEYQVRTVRMHRVVIPNDMEAERAAVHKFLAP